VKKIIVMLIVAVSLLCFGWPVSAADEIAVGAVTPLTGKLAVYGEGFQKAMLLALDEVNAAGGD
jgi:ABC-type branched-subunit amino acid transport system substrate-binding protein